MTIVDGTIGLPADDVGKKVDTSELTVNSQTVERERDNIADPEDAAGIARVRSADPASGDYAIATRVVTGMEERRDRQHAEFQLLTALNAQAAAMQKFGRERFVGDRRGVISMRGMR